MKKIYLPILVLILALFFVGIKQIPAFVYTWNESTPVDGEEYAMGASRMREFKKALRERFAVDHVLYDFASGETTGYHKAIHLLNQTTDPETGTNHGMLYAKKINGEVYPYFRGIHYTQKLSGGLTIETAIGTDDVVVTETRYFTEIPGMTITGVYPAGKIKTTFSASLQVSGEYPGGVVALLCQTIDGETVVNHRFSGDGITSNVVSFSWVATVSEGEHTIKIFWRPQQNGTMIVQYGGTPYFGGKRILMVER